MALNSLINQPTKKVMFFRIWPFSLPKILDLYYKMYFSFINNFKWQEKIKLMYRLFI